jgi:hypothetical protein
MVNAANERTLFVCVIPPGVSYINGINGVAASDLVKLVVSAGLASSLIYDGIVKLQNKSNIFPADIVGLPLPEMSTFFESIGRRTLVLNALTKEYAPLWTACSKFGFCDGDSLVTGESLPSFGNPWNRTYAVRRTDIRAQALLEIDVLTALSIGLTFDELSLFYEVLFPVLSKYDRQNGFSRISRMKEAFGFFEKRGW